MKTELLSAFGDEEKLVNFARFFAVERWWPHMACMDSRDSSIENGKRKSRDWKVRLFFGRDFPWNGWRNRTSYRGTCLVKEDICFALLFKAGIYEVHCNALEHGLVVRRQSGSLQERSPQLVKGMKSSTKDKMMVLAKQVHFIQQGR